MSACPDCGGSIGQLTATKCGRCSERDALKAEVSRLTDALANVSNRADAALVALRRLQALEASMGDDMPLGAAAALTALRSGVINGDGEQYVCAKCSDELED